MKTRNIIFLTLVAVITPISVVMVSGYLIDSLVDEKYSDMLDDKLEQILNECFNDADSDLIDLIYSNDTHYIDNTTCTWEIIERGYIDMPTYEINRNEIQQVLDYCDNKSGTYYEVHYTYVNGTHSIDTKTCEWKEHETFPNTDILCIPSIDKWVTGEGIRNQTHIFDKDSCTWKIDQDYDNVNDKGCPQFCPKNNMENEN